MSDSTVILPAANLPREARALLIAIAKGESDPSAAREGISPYVILYGGGSFESLPDRNGYNRFHDWPGKDNSHAAGRYQFEPATWKGIVPKFGGGNPDFRNPGDQDWGAWMLAQQDYHVRTGDSLLAVLQSGDTSAIGTTLRPTWTSMSDATFPSRYKAALALVASEASLAPASAPLPPSIIGSEVDPVLLQKAVQTALAVLGDYKGAIDGDPGLATRQATNDYRARHGV